MIKAIIVDDDELCRAVISDLLKEVEDIKCVANFGNALDAFKFLNENDLFNKRRLDRYRSRVLNLVKNDLIKGFWTEERKEKLDKATSNLKSTNISPHKLAEKLLAL